MKEKVLGIIALLFPFAGSAEWTLIEDFESYDPSNTPHFQVSSNGGYMQAQIYQGIPGTGGESAAFFTGASFGYFGDAWVHLPLPKEIPINGRGTIFFRLWQYSHTENYNLIFSKLAAEHAPDDTALWGFFSGIFRFNGSNASHIEAHGGGYLPSNPTFTPALESWYRYWIVIDNAFDGTHQQPPGVGGYSIYRQGPDDAHPVLMNWGEEEAISRLPMRNQDYEPIRTFVIYEGLNPGTGYWLIDDIYQADSACVSDPTSGEPCENWCAYPVANNWAQTDDWLGWLYVAEAPWVYSLALDTWIYEPSCPGSNGAWLFVLKDS